MICIRGFFANAAVIGFLDYDNDDFNNYPLRYMPFSRFLEVAYVSSLCFHPIKASLASQTDLDYQSTNTITQIWDSALSWRALK